MMLDCYLSMNLAKCPHRSYPMHPGIHAKAPLPLCWMRKSYHHIPSALILMAVSLTRVLEGQEMAALIFHRCSQHLSASCVLVPGNRHSPFPLTHNPAAKAQINAISSPHCLNPKVRFDGSTLAVPSLIALQSHAAAVDIKQNHTLL